MQPLSYQMTDTSCWLASMLNGIIFLREGKRVPLLAYRLLHMLLTDDGVFYYKKGELENFNNIINAVGSCTDLNIKSYRGNEVEGAIKKLHFNKQVAICDIGVGDHSILLNSLDNGWLEGFDPYWSSVRKKTTEEGFEIQPSVKSKMEGVVNIKIRRDYLLAKKCTKSYQMGAIKYRFLTVIEKR